MLQSFERAAKRANAIARVPTYKAEQPIKKRCTQEMVERISERLERQYQAYKQKQDFRG